MRSEGGMLAGSALALSQLRTHSAHSAVATAAHPDLDRSSPMSRSPAFPSHSVTLVTPVTHCGTARLSSVRPMRCPVHRGRLWAQRRGCSTLRACVSGYTSVSDRAALAPCPVSSYLSHLPCLAHSPHHRAVFVGTSVSSSLSSDWLAQPPSPAGPCADKSTGTVLVGLRASLASVLTHLSPASTCHSRPLFLYSLSFATHTAALRAIYDISIALWSSMCPLTITDTPVLCPCKVS